MRLRASAYILLQYEVCADEGVDGQLDKGLLYVPGQAKTQHFLLFAINLQSDVGAIKKRERQDSLASVNLA